MNLHGHLWTVLPALRDRVRAPRAPVAETVRVPLVDDRFGPVELTGHLRHGAGRRDLVLLVHGLGGEARSGYVQRAAAALHRLGTATLALNLRGADRLGGGFHHVGLTEDLDAAARAPQLGGYERLFAIGFSMGGHTVLRWAAGPHDPRLRSVAAISTPLDVQDAQAFCDGPGAAFYRRYVLGGLKQVYRAVAARHPVPTLVEEVARVRTFRDWDRLTVVPRFSFADPEDYYARVSVSRVLRGLDVPSLLVLAEGDPLTPPHLSLPHVERAGRTRLEVCIARRGGHLYFPDVVDFGAGRSGVLGHVARFFGLADRRGEASRGREGH